MRIRLDNKVVWLRVLLSELLHRNSLFVLGQYRARRFSKTGHLFLLAGGRVGRYAALFKLMRVALILEVALHYGVSHFGIGMVADGRRVPLMELLLHKQVFIHLSFLGFLLHKALKKGFLILDGVSSVK